MRVEQVIAHVIDVPEHRPPERQHLVDRQPGRDRDLRVLGEVGARSEPVLARDGGDRSGSIGHAVVGEVQDVLVQAHRHPARPHVDERRILRELVERRDGGGERDAGRHRLGGEVRDRPAVQHPPVVDAASQRGMPADALRPWELPSRRDDDSGNAPRCGRPVVAAAIAVNYAGAWFAQSGADLL